MYSAVGFMEAQAFIEHFNEQMVIPYPWEVAQSPSSIQIPTSAIARVELTEELAKFFIESGAQSREALLLYMNRNDAESRALFTSLIEQELGETVSDTALLKDINKRLMVTPGVQAMPAKAKDGTTINNPLNAINTNTPLQVQPDGTSIVDGQDPWGIVK
jgi:hypothetical protein